MTEQRVMSDNERFMLNVLRASVSADFESPLLAYQWARNVASAILEGEYTGVDLESVWDSTPDKLILKSVKFNAIYWKIPASLLDR